MSEVKMEYIEGSFNDTVIICTLFLLHTNQTAASQMEIVPQNSGILAESCSG